jgi:hypothetical protein
MRTISIALFMLCVGAAGCAEVDPTGAADPVGQEQQPEKLMSCGGFAGGKCPKGFTCADDPSDSCDPTNGGADCAGVCVESNPPPRCGGFANFPCSDGLTCVDDPSDDCDPKKGGADCSGICVQP